MIKFYVILGIALTHFIIFGILLMIHHKNDSPKSEGITWASTFGFGMSFIYLFEALGLIIN